MTLIEDLRLAIQDVCRAMGLSSTSVTVVPVVVLGCVLNIVALRVVDNVHAGHRIGCQQARPTSIAQSELKLVRITVAASLKKISEAQRALCSAKQWLLNQQIQPARHESKMSSDWVAYRSGESGTLSITTHIQKDAYIPTKSPRLQPRLG